MKRMLCYFLLCALALTCIAGCISGQPGATTDPTGSPSLQSPQNTQTQGDQNTKPQGTQNNQPQQTEPSFAVPEYELEPLPTIDRETVGPLVTYDPDRKLYILAGQNDIIYADHWGNNSYGMYIFSKNPLNVDSISVSVPISYYYSVSVRQIELGGIEKNVNQMNEQQYQQKNFSYPLYLAYCGKDFRKLAELKHRADQLQKLLDEYSNLAYTNQIDQETYQSVSSDQQAAYKEYQEYLNAEWNDYLALTKQDLPQFYVYAVSIHFINFEDLSAKLEKEETFHQIEVTIGDKTYAQDIGKVMLIKDWKLPAPLDWETAYDATAGIMGSANSPMLYNDGIHRIEIFFHFVADRYKLLEELVMLNPAQKVERVWLQIKPKGGRTIVVEWDMSEPYEIYPGDDVVVYAAYSDENLETIGYQTMTDAYLLYTTDGESFCKFSHSRIALGGSYYLWYAVLFDGIDLESYYWDYYYRFFEPWRYDPEEDPVWYE